MPGNDDTDRLVESVRSAHENSEPLRIRGSGSKFFYGRPIVGTVLDVSKHQGITSYEPSEMVLTARAGTTLREITQALSDSHQSLGFEPPWFGDRATLGGTIACGLSGPRRPFAGSARDFVLGVKCITGTGEFMAFGGQVIKNVAGYDVSRLMVGAMGTLGVLCEISIRVLPKHEVEVTRLLELDEDAALTKMADLPLNPYPLSGLSYSNGVLRVRLSGTENGTMSAGKVIGGEEDPQGSEYWRQLREQELNFFNRNQTLWRVSVPPTAPAFGLSSDCVIDWGGALRWVYTDKSEKEAFEIARNMNGHAILFRGDEHYQGERFSKLPQKLSDIHSGLKTSFDPSGILNSGIMYEDL